MRYDDHSKLFNGEDPKFSALVSDDQSPTGDQMGNDAIEIYMHFAVRPDPDYHASHTGDASVYLTAPGQEIDLELVSEGVDPVRLNPPPDGESSTRLSYDPPDNEALSVSFFAAASSSEGEKSVFRLGIRLARHACYFDETGYLHVNHLSQTRSMWREKVLRNDPLPG